MLHLVSLNDFLNIKLSKRYLFIKEITQVGIMLRVDISCVNHLLFGQFTNILHAKRLIYAFVFFAELIENDKFRMTDILTALNDTSVYIFSKTHIISIITLASHATEYPVKLVNSIESSDKESRIGILLQMVHRKKFLWYLIMPPCFYLRHYILW